MSIRFNNGAGEVDWLTRTANLPTNSEHSVCFWFKRVSGEGNVSFIGDTGSNNEMGFYVTAGNQFSYYDSPSGVTTNMFVAAADTWYFVALKSTHPTANSRVAYAAYGDADLTFLNPTSGAIATTNIFRLGRDSVFTGFQCNCAIQAFKLWGVGISDDDMRNERWNFVPRRFDGLNDWYPFLNAGDVTGQTNGYAWTVSGAPTTEENVISWRARKASLIGVGLRRDQIFQGTTIVNFGSSAAHYGQATEVLASGTSDFDFWFPGVPLASFAAYLETAVWEAWLYPVATDDHSADEHFAESYFFRCSAKGTYTNTGIPVLTMAIDSVYAGQQEAVGLNGIGGKLIGVTGKWRVAWCWEMLSGTIPP